jgi:hypothetical protein
MRPRCSDNARRTVRDTRCWGQVRHGIGDGGLSRAGPSRYSLSGKRQSAGLDRRRLPHQKNVNSHRIHVVGPKHVLLHRHWHQLLPAMPLGGSIFSQFAATCDHHQGATHPTGKREQLYARAHRALPSSGSHSMNASAYCSMVPANGGEGNGTPRWFARCRVSRLHPPPITRASVSTSGRPTCPGLQRAALRHQGQAPLTCSRWRCVGGRSSARAGCIGRGLWPREATPANTQLLHLSAAQRASSRIRVWVLPKTGPRCPSDQRTRSGVVHVACWRGPAAMRGEAPVAPDRM